MSKSKIETLRADRVTWIITCMLDGCIIRTANKARFADMVDKYTKFDSADLRQGREAKNRYYVYMA